MHSLSSENGAGHWSSNTVTGTGDAQPLYMGIMKLKDAKHWRRVDLVFATSTEWVLAVLGWTGPREFERSLRHFADKKVGCVASSS